MAGMPRVGDVVYCNDVELLSPHERSLFAERSWPKVEAGVVAPYRVWLRQTPDWKSFATRHEALPGPSLMVGNAILPANRLPGRPDEPMLAIQPLSDASGTATRRRRLIHWRTPGDAGVWFYITHYDSLVSQDKQPASQEAWISEPSIRWWPAAGAVMIRLAEPSLRQDGQEAVIAFEVEQVGRRHHVEVLLVDGRTRVEVNGKLPNNRDRQEVGWIDPPTADDRGAADLPEPAVVAERLSSHRPTMHYRSSVDGFAICDASERRVYLVGAEPGAVAGLPFSNFPKSDAYRPETDELCVGSGERGVTFFDLSRGTFRMGSDIRLPQFEYRLANVTGGQGLIVTGYRAPVQRWRDDGTIVWSHPDEEHRALAAGRRCVAIFRTPANDAELLTLDLETGQVRSRIRVAGQWSQLKLSPDETMAGFVTESQSGVIDLQTGRYLAMTAEPRNVEHVSFSPDGRWVAFSGQRLSVVDLADRSRPRWHQLPRAFTDEPDQPGRVSRHVRAAEFGKRSDVLYLYVVGHGASLQRVELPD